jgi:DNA replication protein DnaC
MIFPSESRLERWRKGTTFPKRAAEAVKGLAESGCPDSAVLGFLMRMLDDDEDRPTMAVLLGDRGVGKTCLLTSLGYDFYVNFGLGARYTTASEMVAELKGSFDREFSDSASFVTLFKRYTQVRYLAIDEMEVRSLSQWEYNTLTAMVDKRYQRGLTTVMASNLSPQSFHQVVGDSIWSRLGECGGVLQCSWPSRRPPPPVIGRKGPGPPRPPRPPVDPPEISF